MGHKKPWDYGLGSLLAILSLFLRGWRITLALLTNFKLILLPGGDLIYMFIFLPLDGDYVFSMSYCLCDEFLTKC